MLRSLALSLSHCSLSHCFSLLHCGIAKLASTQERHRDRERQREKEKKDLERDERERGERERDAEIEKGKEGEAARQDWQAGRREIYMKR